MHQLSSRDYLFVAVQFFLFAVYLWSPSGRVIGLPDPVRLLSWAMIVPGLLYVAVAILQLKTSLSPFPSPIEHGRLVTTGVYRLARHPIYAGVLWAALGNALRTGLVAQFVVTVLLGVLFYFKSRYEEELLVARYPEYIGYRERVGRFWWKGK